MIPTDHTIMYALITLAVVCAVVLFVFSPHGAR